MADSDAPVRDLVSENFGFLIAYLFPGLVVIGGTALWSPAIAAWLGKAASGDANVGAFVLLAVVASGVGVVLQTARWFVFEKALRWAGWFPPAPTGLDRSRENEPAVQAAMMAIRDNHYRYYQANAGLAVALPFVFACYFAGGAANGVAWVGISTALGTALFAWAGRDAYERNSAKAAAVLGKEHAE